MAESPNCAECGGPIQQLDRGRPRRFCGDKCKARHHNRRQNRARRPLATPTEKLCAHCGASFIAKSRDRIYCYDKWCPQAAYAARKRAGMGRLVRERVVRCDGCGAEFLGRHPSARWCSKSCANKHWGLIRSRQRGTVSVEDYTDHQVFERDNWTCHICGQTVDPALDRLHEMGATIDHVIPLSKGGIDELDNVALAHWSCNRVKRAQ